MEMQAQPVRQMVATGRSDPKGTWPKVARSARSFTMGEKSLIQKVHGYMPAEQLLAILNDRLIAAQGLGVVPYTMDQLRAELASIEKHERLDDGSELDWPALRKQTSRASCGARVYSGG